MNVKYNKIFDKPIGLFETILSGLDKSTDIELDKFYKSAKDIIKDEKLKELSSMNNYFIFKKK